MRIALEVAISGHASFNGEVPDGLGMDEAMLAVYDAIFAELSQHLDCRLLMVGPLTYAEYLARRQTQRGVEIV